MGTFVLYPLLLTIVDSMKQMNLMRPNDVSFIGFSNYKELLTDSSFSKIVSNSALYVIFATIFQVVFGLYIALVLKNKFKGRGLLLAVVIVPWALPPVVNGVIWKWIYDPTYGVLNDLLIKLNLIESGHIWLGDSTTALIAITIVHVWKMTPLTAVILLAALQTIPEELYEAATMDGANKVQSLWHITAPMLKPALAIALTQITFASINLFDEIYVLTGTSLDTRSLLIENYLIAFRNLNLGKGMALSLLISLVTLLLCVFYIWILSERRKKVI